MAPDEQGAAARHEDSRGEVTVLIERAGSGDERALDDLWSRVYHEIHELAESYLRREANACTLQTTEAVSEVYLKVFQHGSPDWENRRHFFGSIARAMGQMLIDRARKRHAAVRGGGWGRVSLDDAGVATDDCGRAVDHGGGLVADALDRMGQEHPRAADVARLRYLMGLSVAHTAAVLDVSERTVKSDWRFARAWIRRELDDGDEPADPSTARAHGPSHGA